jgi:hypothetical protein
LKLAVFESTGLALAVLVLILAVHVIALLALTALLTTLVLLALAGLRLSALLVLAVLPVAFVLVRVLVCHLCISSGPEKATTRACRLFRKVRMLRAPERRTLPAQLAVLLLFAVRRV